MDAKFLHVDNEGSDQTAWMCRLIFVGCTCQKVHFLTMQLIYATVYLDSICVSVIHFNPCPAE